MSNARGIGYFFLAFIFTIMFVSLAGCEPNITYTDADRCVAYVFADANMQIDSIVMKDCSK